MGVALVSLDVSGARTYVPLTPFHIGEVGSDGGPRLTTTTTIDQDIFDTLECLHLLGILCRGRDVIFCRAPKQTE